MEPTQDAVARLLSLLLGQPVAANDDTRMESCTAWDSMKHIEIIMTIEEHFGVSFEPQDIPRLTTQALLTAKVEELSGV